MMISDRTNNQFLFDWKRPTFLSTLWSLWLDIIYNRMNVTIKCIYIRNGSQSATVYHLEWKITKVSRKFSMFNRPTNWKSWTISKVDAAPKWILIQISNISWSKEKQNSLSIQKLIWRSTWWDLYSENRDCCATITRGMVAFLRFQGSRWRNHLSNSRVILTFQVRSWRFDAGGHCFT